MRHLKFLFLALLTFSIATGVQAQQDKSKENHLPLKLKPL